MELQTLKNFIAIAEAGNITAAAKHLGLSQPALSRQLKELEGELGVQLLSRGNRRVTLTEDGVYLLNRARELTVIAARTKNNLQAKHTLGGEIYIGAGETSAKAAIIKTLIALRQRYPAVHLHFVYGNEEQLVANLDAGMLDFIIRPVGERQNDHSLTLPQQDAWGIFMPSRDPMTNGLLITPNDLQGKKLILPRASHTRLKFEHWLGAGIDPSTIPATYDLSSDAIALVLSGVGRALLQEDQATKATSPLFAFRPLAPGFSETLQLEWKQDHELSRIATQFLDQLRLDLKA